MAWSEKLLEALRKGMVLNERLNGLAEKIERLDQNVRDLDRRVVRLETLVEIGSQHARRLTRDD